MNRALRKSLLTVRERVLLHLFPLQRYAQDSDAPRTVTQDGIATAVDVGRNNVAKILQELGDEGIIENQSKHVKGLPSIRRVYFLTQAGFEEAKRLKDEVEAIEVDVLDLKGVEHKDTIGRLSVYLPNNYSFLELTMGVARGRFDCQSFHEGKVKEERRFVDFSDKKPAVRNFFGREKENRQLIELLTSDVTRAVVVYGIPGIGKTTLLAKFAQDVRERTNVFWLKVHEWVSVKGLLRPLAEFLSQMGKKNLEWYLNQNEVPVTGEVLQILITDLEDVPALLIFDDVQKCEKTVQELLRALLGVVEEMPRVRLICATRDLPAFYSRSLVVKNVVKELQLDGLDRTSSERMLRSRSIPEEHLEQIVQITKGHPLFLELIEDPESALGKNIRMFIEHEVMSKLDPAERRVTNVAAVFRYPVMMDAFFIADEEINREMKGGEQDIEPHNYTISYETVDSLIGKSILHETVGRVIGMHDLLREFTYSRLTPRQRLVFHRAAARFYLQDSSLSSQVEALYHCIMAKDLSKALDIASARGDDIIAKGYATQLSPLLEKLIADGSLQHAVERPVLLMQHARILQLWGEYDRALAEFKELIDTLPGEDSLRILAETYRHIGSIEMARSRFPESRANLETALEYALKIGDLSTQAEINYDRGGLAERLGENVEAIRFFELAGEQARKAGDRLSLGRSLYGIGRVKGNLMEWDEAYLWKSEALTVLEKAGDANMIAKVSSSLGNNLRMMRRNDEALQMFERAIELANSVGDVNTLAYVLSNMAAAHLESNDLANAEDLIHQATRIFQKLNDRLMIATMHLYRGFLFQKRGDWEWARDEFRQTVEIMKGMGHTARLARWTYEVAKAYLQAGDLIEAEKMLNEAGAAADSSGQLILSTEIQRELQALKR
ncbi:MAG TPA: tetratricopeptide repeat protein [Methanomassiliicoccales archaeon]|nr:tetratricopeptide repeat protein [Methanomassiliicoccales archaeon]